MVGRPCERAHRSRIRLAEDGAVSLVSTLIRIDKTDTGDPKTLKVTRAPAECVAEQLAGACYETAHVESRGPRLGASSHSCSAPPYMGALLAVGYPALHR